MGVKFSSEFICAHYAFAVRNDPFGLMIPPLPHKTHFSLRFSNFVRKCQVLAGKLFRENKGCFFCELLCDKSLSLRKGESQGNSIITLDKRGIIWYNV